MQAAHQLTCKLEILTPVHVGSGDAWQQSIDFHLHDRALIVVDIEKLFEHLLSIPENNGQTALDKYTQLLGQGNKGFKLENYLRDIDIDWENVALSKFDYPYDETTTEIRTLNRSMRQIYLPGSSIKGAISSVLINTIKRKRNMDIGKYKNERSDYKFIEDTIGRFDRSISRFIRPVDVFLDESELHNVQLFNLYQNFDWESDYKTHKLLTLETFKTGTQGDLQLSVDIDWLKLAEEHKQFAKNQQFVINRSNPIQEIFYHINRYTYDHLKKEIAFFEHYNQAEASEEIIYTLKELQAQTLNNKDACILRLGFGSGFHAITGDWMYGSHLTPINQPDQNRKRYKSRKLADYQPMGFVKLSLPDDVPRLREWSVMEVPTKKTIKPSEELQTNYIESQEIQKAIMPDKFQPVFIDFKDIQKEKPIIAEVIKLGKPFSQVKLYINNSPFDMGNVQMSGTKKAKLKPGQIVKVLINSVTANGEIKSVKYLR